MKPEEINVANLEAEYRSVEAAKQLSDSLFDARLVEIGKRITQLCDHPIVKCFHYDGSVKCFRCGTLWLNKSEMPEHVRKWVETKGEGE